MNKIHLCLVCFFNICLVFRWPYVVVLPCVDGPRPLFISRVANALALTTQETNRGLGLTMQHF